MKYILTILLLISALVKAQSNTENLPSYGVYTSVADYNSHTVTNGFSENDKTHKLRDEVTHRVEIINGQSSVNYSYDSIWGFRKKGEDWRIFNNRIYKVVYTGKACVYIRPTKTDMSIPGLTRFETTYFSATPESPVYPLTQENLVSAFKDDSALVKKVNSLPASALVTKKDKASGLYEFITWL